MSEVPDGFRETPLGPLPETWDVVRLGEVLKQRIEKVEVKPDEEYTRLGVHWYAAGPFKKDVVLGEEIRSKYLYKVEPEHFIYNRLFGWKGSFGVVSEDMADCHVSSEFPLFRVAGEIADPWYLWRWFSQSSVWKRIEDQSMGSTRTSRLRLKVADLLAMEVPLPPLPEQRAIAHVLRTVQRAREATDGVIAAVRELKRSLMRHLFTYGPVPVDEAEWVELRDTEIGAIPVHWSVVQLGEIVEQPQYGYTASAAKQPIGPKFLRITDIQNGVVRWRSVPHCKIEEEQLDRYRLKRGDIVIARIGATTGKTYLVRDCPDSVFASYLIRVRAKPELVTPEYLGYFAETGSYWTQINASKGGRLKKGVNIPILGSLLLPLAPRAEQDEIARALSTVDAKIAAEEARREALDGLFHSLLRHLMTGRIRTQEFQRQAARTPSREEENLGDFAP
jgi:type I restriction enzyme S subunit